MSESLQASYRVLADEDRFGEYRDLGISTAHFKVSTPDSSFFALELVFHAKGGPARHRHLEQDEWFYVVQGEFVFEIGEERFSMSAGDSLYGPRRVPHVWAHVSSGQGRLLITFTPAGKMEPFFQEIAKANAMAPQNPALWQAYGMELLGPPLRIE